MKFCIHSTPIIGAMVVVQTYAVPKSGSRNNLEGAKMKVEEHRGSSSEENEAFQKRRFRGVKRSPNRF